MQGYGARRGESPQAAGPACGSWNYHGCPLFSTTWSQVGKLGTGREGQKQVFGSHRKSASWFLKSPVFMDL